MGGIISSIGNAIGGVFDAVGGIFGGPDTSAQEAAMRAQADAQKKVLQGQREQMQKQQAQAQQAQNQAFKDRVNAASTIRNKPVTNSSSLTGGAGISNDELLLGSSAVLGGIDYDDEKLKGFK